MSHKDARGWFTLSSALTVAAGIALVVVLIWKTGDWAEIRDGMLKVGWAFPVIVALGGLRFLVRAAAWSLCIEPPHRLRLHHAFAAVLAGDSLGNATPLGPVVGEPAKAAFARKHVATGAAVTALAVENLFYTISTAAMIAAGTIALLFAFDLQADVREYSEIAVALVLLLLVTTFVMLWRRPALVGRLSGSGRLRALEQEIYSFSSRRRRAVLPVAALEIAFHALGVLETHITMVMILPEAPPLLVSFVLETFSRLVTVIFKFVPLQVGVAEGSLALATELLGMGTAPGVTFSLVRKARIIVWALAGAVLFVREGVGPGNLDRALDFSPEAGKSRSSR